MDGGKASVRKGWSLPHVAVYPTLPAKGSHMQYSPGILLLDLTKCEPFPAPQVYHVVYGPIHASP